MQFGRYYEEFEIGATTSTGPGKTVTEYDDHLFCLLTMNHHPLHLDAELRRRRRPTSARTWWSATTSTRCCWACRCRTSAARPSPTWRSSRCGTSRRPSTATRSTARRRYWTRPRRSRSPTAGRARRDDRLQPGRHRGVHLPAQGDGADAGVHRGAWRRAARPADSGGPLAGRRGRPASRPASAPRADGRRRAVGTRGRRPQGAAGSPTRPVSARGAGRAGDRRTPARSPTARRSRRRRHTARRPPRMQTKSSMTYTRRPGPSRSTRPGRRSAPDLQPGLLGDLPDAGGGGRLAGQAAAPRHRPGARATAAGRAGPAATARCSSKTTPPAHGTCSLTTRA